MNCNVLICAIGECLEENARWVEALVNSIESMLRQQQFQFGVSVLFTLKKKMLTKELFFTIEPNNKLKQELATHVMK